MPKVDEKKLRKLAVKAEMEGKKDYKPTKCLICGEWFDSWSELVEHCKSHLMAVCVSLGVFFMGLPFYMLIVVGLGIALMFITMAQRMG